MLKIPFKIYVALLLILPISHSIETKATNPIIPMTAITGRPTRGDVTRLLNEYRYVGIEQFLIYPRSGLEIEYMSPEWMNFVRNCLEVADSLGMKVWLYDEYNWPSGNCRGAVTADGHENCWPKLLLFEKDSTGNYTTRLTYNRIGADILDPEAAQRFIDLTHERYYKEFGQYFGRVIPAIFTDEPSFSYANFTGSDREHFGLVRYDGLEEDYRNRCGRDLKSDVISFLNGNDSPELWRNYYTLIGERMRHNYIERLSSWCEAHGIKLTGHLMYEKLYKSVRCNGNALRMLSGFGLPGFDEANSDIDINAQEMEVSGLSLVQYASRDKDGAICELYSVGPADLTLSMQRQLMWMCAAFGVNNYIVAVSATDARGNIEKGDWYFSSGPTQPWFDYYREFGAEAEKAALFARKPYTPEYCVRVPSTYFMGLDKTDAFEERGKMHLRFLEGLLAHQLQYILLDEDETPPAGVPVLNFDGGGFFVEGEEERYDDLETYFNHILGLKPRSVVVTDEKGKEVRDVLVRRWDDGSFILVDMTDNDRTDRRLSVTSNGRKGSIRLQGHGVFAGTMEEMDYVPDTFRKRIRLKDLSLTPTYTNIVRCLYLEENPCFSFKVRDARQGVRLIVRKGAAPVEVSLDGEPVEPGLPADRLPEGFRQLYASSRTIHPGKGKHHIRVTNGAVDYRFLPAVFMSGDFLYDKSSCSLLPWDGKGRTCTKDCIPDYTGSYVISADAYIPRSKGLSISLDTNLACTELSIDGISLGRKAWGPYEWTVPEYLQGGTHHLKIHISNSVMPLFGDLDRLEKEQPYISWLRIKPGQHGDKATTGLFGASFRSPEKL